VIGEQPTANATGHARLDFYTMSEDNERYWAAEMAKAGEAVAGQMVPILQAAEALGHQTEPFVRGLEMLRRQMEPFAQVSEAYRRQIEPIARAVEQFARIVNWPKINIGPVPPYPLWLANAVDAQMRDLLSPRPAAHQITAAPEVAAAGGLALSPTVFVSDSDVATASEKGSVEDLDSRRRVLAGLSAGQILALVLLWLVVLGVPAAVIATDLPPDVQATVDAYDAILAALAVEITFRILSKRNKR
jgi:hypothetical protein